MAEPSADSLLTKTQRTLLVGEADYDHQDPAGRTARTRMRKRLAAGLQDFQQLADSEALPEEDVAQLREMLSDETTLGEVLPEVVAFMYRLDPEGFEPLIQAGVQRGVDRFTPEHEVGEVSIPIHEHGGLLSQARDNLESAKPLSEKEAITLLMEGDIDADRVRRHIQEHPIQLGEQYLYRYR